jgi:tetratricopeptide (TPR) repeat protein
MDLMMLAVVPVAESLFNLAHIYHRHFDRFDKAEELYKRALTIRRAALGPEDPGVVANIEEYAALLRERGREEAAEALERCALLLRCRRRGRGAE